MADTVLKQYKGFEIKKVVIPVSDEEIDAAMNRIQQHHKEVVEVDRPAENGDKLTLDFTGYVDGEAFDGGAAENYELVLGSHTFIPGFEDQLVGAVAGADVDVNVTFPEKYAPEVAGKAAVFKCHIHKITTERTQSFDELAKSAGLENEAALRDTCVKLLEHQNAAKADKIMETQVRNLLADNYVGEVPEDLLEEAYNDTMEATAKEVGLTGDQLKAQFESSEAFKEALENIKKQAMLRAKGFLALEEIVRLEGLGVSVDDVKAEVARLAKSYELEEEEFLNYVKIKDVENSLTHQKALNVVMENLVVTED
ncbi:MAG: trigger factor [Lachnospiraceae bacterium]|nr:trigger factor [Lachnospiraceae bacterium]